MKTKTGILIILAVLGLALMGGGLWLWYDSTQIKVTLPEGAPVIYERLDYVMRGQSSMLLFYKDGGIFYIEEKGWRPPGGQPIRIWKTAKFTQPQLESLLAYLQNSGLDKLDESYVFPGEPVEGGGLRQGDMGFAITVYSESFKKSVTAFGYITPDNGETYPDMPSPLNDIYGRLRLLAVPTQEVYRENLSP
jgi:hypothetical protein